MAAFSPIKIAGMNPAPHLVLVGPMGAGKTSIGRKLADRMGLPFTDVDEEIERRAGTRVSTIFDCEGEAGFRARERDLLAEVLSELGHTEVSGRITEVTDGTFMAELEIDGHVISARPSDVVALAIRAGIVVTCPAALLEEVGVVLEEEAGDDEVEKFREFLDNITPDDFEAGDDPDGPSAV